MRRLPKHHLRTPFNDEGMYSAEQMRASYERGREEQAKRIAELEDAMHEIMRRLPRGSYVAEVAEKALEARDGQE